MLRPRPSFFLAIAVLAARATAAPASPADAALDRTFQQTVRPFVETYCVACHGQKKPEAELDLTPYSTMAAVLGDYANWELILERVGAGDMPSKKAKKFPDDAERAAVVTWIQAVRKNEAQKNADDPGPVLARRLSNPEYDYTIRDLTGVDIRPTKEFPIDPANQAGFANSGESLTMSPALLKKYLQAARTVADHLVLKPEGFTFAAHPVVADTDRDKYAVLRIVDFYQKQPTDLASYFEAAWRYRHRAALGQPNATLADIATASKVSPKYLTTVWATLNDTSDLTVGPLAKLQALWQALPSGAADASAARAGCERMREFVVTLRGKIVPEVKNLKSPPIQEGSQTFVLWKDRQMAANRRRYDATALHVAGEKPVMPAAPEKPAPAAVAPKGAMKAAPTIPAPVTNPATASRISQNADIIQKGGVSLPPAILTTGSSATFQLASARKRSDDPDLVVPADPAERARHERAFARFAEVFPDAFLITERARVYLDAEKEQKNAGRLLSAGLHSMTGYFRDDGPLYDMLLDDAGRRELDQLWQEFDFLAAVPQRMHTSFAWFERTDSTYMRDAEFDPFRPEDKSILTPEKIRKLGELYLAKAQANNASDVVQGAIREHFEIVAANIARVDHERTAAEPSHLTALLDFAQRAYRRPLTTLEREQILTFYRTSRKANGLDHEDAMRDSIAAVLMSPSFCFRVDLVAEHAAAAVGSSRFAPLSDYALASRLSYFLWSTLPDTELLAHAAAGGLHRPEVLAAQARRMLRDPRVRNFAVEFGGHWLDFRRFEEHNAVDRERFPAFDHDLRQAMFEEPLRFIVDLVREDRSVLNFLYADYTFVNAPLARHYGMPVPSGPASEWVRVEQASRYERGGLLPMAVFLTANSPGLRTSPVKRGYWIARRILGERIPPPPAVVPDLPNDEKHLGDLTLREALVRHRADPSCAACHARFDSFGLAFEGFGAIGERREKDFGGHAVDPLASFPGGGEGRGFAGLRDYVRGKREHDFVDNLCRKLVTYGLGRTLLPSDDALVGELHASLSANGHRFSPLIEAIVTSPQFRTKRALVAAPALTSVP